MMETMTDAQKLANVRRWRDHYKAERKIAEDEVVRLEKERDGLLTACKMLHKALLYCGSADVRLRLEQEALAKYDIVVYEPRFTK